MTWAVFTGLLFSGRVLCRIGTIFCLKHLVEFTNEAIGPKDFVVGKFLATNSTSLISIRPSRLSISF